MGSNKYTNGTFTPYSNNIRYFDTKCILNHGDYIKISIRLCSLTKDLLRLEEVEDYVDIEEEKAWLRFKHNGVEYHWDFQVDRAWVDVNVFVKFYELLKTVDTTISFTYLDLGGQDLLIGCCSEENLLKIIETTGLEFKWLVTE
ncbi:hypothetical protein [Paenibacillus sp. LjRoot56]|uniref:hypothetical protein n=1 Tax=Paenibacillus sp. LjRoot56 TaxID=3342333 RepID=UPI003ED0E6EE